MDFTKSEYRLGAVQTWRSMPWQGWIEARDPNRKEWHPKRFYYEFFVLLTGQHLGNDPDAWEAWFKAHPNLIWDEKQKRLVDRPSAP